MSEIIFETIHGSRLYGLDHENSDRDSYVVTTSRRRKPRQTVQNGNDVVTVGISTFLEYAKSGSHQSVEALFSPYKVWHDESWRPLIEGMRIGGADVFAKYERTIKAFCYGDFKRRRHAVRLSFALKSLRTYNRFNPLMTSQEIADANRLADQYEGFDLREKLL